MKREIKNNGEYVEIDSSEILTGIEKLEAADIIVVKSARIELAGEEKKTFVNLVSQWKTFLMECDQYFANDMTVKQQADVIFRKMLLSTDKGLVKTDVFD